MRLKLILLITTVFIISYSCSPLSSTPNFKIFKPFLSFSSALLLTYSNIITPLINSHQAHYIHSTISTAIADDELSLPSNNNEVEEDQDDDLNSLRRVTNDDSSATSTTSETSSKGGNKIDKNYLTNANLEISREIVLTLKAYLDEAERDLFAKKYDNVLVYLNTISEQEDSFSDLIYNLYPNNENLIEISAKDALIFEGKAMFLALDNLREACVDKRINAAEKYYAKLLLSYDRFLKAGDLYPTYVR